MDIRKMDPFKESETVQSIARVYQGVFGNKPWNEGYQCPVCKKTFPLLIDSHACPMCKKDGWTILLVEFWPANKVISDFYAEMKKPGATCLVAKENDTIVGFAWGYKVITGPELDTNLEAPGLHKLLRGKFFYGDECAVLPEYRGRGIGKKLTEKLFSRQKVLLRTKANSPMQVLIENLGGTIIQRISNDRVIMTLSL